MATTPTYAFPRLVAEVVLEYGHRPGTSGLAYCLAVPDAEYDGDSLLRQAAYQLVWADAGQPSTWDGLHKTPAGEALDRAADDLITAHRDAIEALREQGRQRYAWRLAERAAALAEHGQ